MAALLDLENFTVELPTPRGWVRPVNEVSLHLDEGEALGLVGESGCGKTMLSLGLMALVPHGARRAGSAWMEVSKNGISGRLNLAGRYRKKCANCAAREIAMIFQEPMTALDPVMRMGAQIEEAIRAHEPSLSRGRNSPPRHRIARTRRRARACKRARQFPHQLSGGLRQRAMIAMALAMRSAPADRRRAHHRARRHRAKANSRIARALRRELHLTLLFITHDLGVVAQIADRIAVMYAGRIVEEGPAREVLANPRHPYTEGLLRAAPRLERGKLGPHSRRRPASQ